MPPESRKTLEEIEKKIGRAKRNKILTLQGKAIAISRALKKRLGIITNEKEREAWARLLVSIADNQTLSAEDVLKIPESTLKTGLTRFDHLFQACYNRAFPRYNKNILYEIMGGHGADPDIRLWKAIFPRELGVSNVTIRATDYREAFGKACDYACRVHLRLYGIIPKDLSVRIKYVHSSEASLVTRVRKGVRKANENCNSKGHEKRALGVQIATMGIHDKGSEKWSIFRYSESKDLSVIRMFGRERVSDIDRETFEDNFQNNPFTE